MPREQKREPSFPINNVEYSKLRSCDLSDLCKQRGLQSQKGNKKQLIARLEAADDKMLQKATRERKRVHDGKDVNGTSKHRKKNTSNKSMEKKVSIQKDRASLVLWGRPLMTLYYFVMELFELIRELAIKLWKNRNTVLFVLLTFLMTLAAYHADGPHQKYVLTFRKKFLWCAYWVGLGILSSVGLGTGLHTFLLYLGPHIAAVTLAAFECMSVDFPEPPYPDDIVCPEEEGTTMSVWTIISKVRLEAFMWGAGTAIGELPPYFMARAARLSGQIDEEEQEMEELLMEKKKHPDELSFLDKGKIVVHNLVQRVGFAGILLCASIPNPLFDLAGITCGHFLVPFWTFFGATLIGKAIIKMHIQKLFVVFLFSERHVEHVGDMVGRIPYFGRSLENLLEDYLEKQKAKLHVKPGTAVTQESSWLSWIFEKLVLIMVIYFVLSIINSMAQSYHKRLSKRSQEKTSD